MLAAGRASNAVVRPRPSWGIPRPCTGRPDLAGDIDFEFHFSLALCRRRGSASGQVGARPHRPEHETTSSLSYRVAIPGQGRKRRQEAIHAKDIQGRHDDSVHGALCAALLLTGAATAHGAEGHKKLTLDPVLVTARGVPAPASQTPGGIGMVTEEESRAFCPGSPRWTTPYCPCAPGPHRP